MRNTPLSKPEARAFLKRVRLLKQDLKHKNVADTWKFLGVPRSTWRAWEDGEAVPSRETVVKIDTLLQDRLVALDREVRAVSNYVSHVIPTC